MRFVQILCLCLFAYFLIPSLAFCQETKAHIGVFDGFLVGGYIDGGAYLNFTGPNINFKKGKSKLVLGMLPSLRFKKDNASPRNPIATPSLGIGLTYSYHIWAFQLPLYFNPKTATTNGAWNVGFGLGINFSQIK